MYENVRLPLQNGATKARPQQAVGVVSGRKEITIWLPVGFSWDSHAGTFTDHRRCGLSVVRVW